MENATSRYPDPNEVSSVAEVDETDLATSLQRTRSKPPTNLNQTECLEIWGEFRKGKEPHEIAKQKNRSIETIVAAIQFARFKLAGILSPRIEQQRLIDYIRNIVGDLDGEFRTSRQIINQLNLWIADRLQVRTTDEDGVIQYSPLSVDDLDLELIGKIQGLLTLRRGEMDLALKTASEIRAFNAQLADFTGVRAVAKKPLGGKKVQDELESQLTEMSLEELRAYRETRLQTNEPEASSQQP